MNKNKLRSTVVTLIVAMVLIGMTFGAMADPGNVPNPRLTVSTVDDVSVYKWLGLIGIQYPVVNTDSSDSSINENVAVQNTGFNESEDSKPLSHGLSQTQIGILSYSYESDRLKITVGEQSSSGWNYQYDPVGDPDTFIRSVYGEHYAVATDTWGSVKRSDSDFTVDTCFGSPEAPDTATLHYGNLSLTRQVDPPIGGDRSFSITFVLTNTGDSTLENVRFFQGVDYDIYDTGNDYAWYSEATDTVWQNDDNYFKNGFRGSRTSSHHDCNQWSSMWDDMHSGTLNDLTKYPESSTADCGIALQWDVGDLAPQASWDLAITFYFGEAAGIEANAGPDQNAGRSQPVTFDASGSSSVGNITTYEWDFDNDSIYDVSVSTPVYVYGGWTELGEYTVGLRVTDDEGRNDTNTVKITVVPNVDLTVSTVAFAPTGINDGDTVIFNATVENIGTEALTDDFYVRFEIDDGHIGRQRVSGGIPAGDSVHVLQNWGADAGTHNVSVYADSGYYSSENNLIPEANETNNKRSHALPEILFPDLTITNLVWSPTDGIGDGDTVTFTITVENIGTGSTSSDFYVGLEIDGNYIGSQQVSGLSAGNSTEVSHSWDADAGTHTVKAVVDYYSEITESNETNDERSQALPEIPFPDLTVTDITWSPPTDIRHGDTVTFTATVENIGAGNTSSNFYVRFTIDDGYIGHQKVSGGLTAGGSSAVNLDWIAFEGDHTIKVIVDEYNAITEFNESNNEKSEVLPPIPQPPQVNATSPNGGEIWHGAQDITWGATSPEGLDLTIKIELYNGHSYELIADALPNTGVYQNWDTSRFADGSPVPDSTYYKMRATATDTSGVSGSDLSDDWLTIWNTPIVEISSAPYSQTTTESVNATYYLTIVNKQPSADTFDLLVDNTDNAAVAELSQSSITLDPWESVTVNLNITDETSGTYRVTARAVSHTNVSITGEVTVTTYVKNAFTVGVSAPRTQTSIGGNLTYEVEIANNQGTSDTFTLTVTGIEGSWCSMVSSCQLTAGGTKTIPLAISIPDTASASEFSLTIQATSSNIGTTRETSAPLNVSATPLIFDLTPADNTHTGANEVLFCWRTSVTSTSDVFIKAEGEVDYTLVSNESGTSHAVPVSDLSRDTWYNFYVRSNSTHGSATSEVRNIFIDNGITFSQRNYEFTIERDYNQERTITIVNTDDEPHEVLLNVSGVPEDLALNFVGEGSMDQVIPLHPGESKDIAIAFHAQDAQVEDYTILFNLTNLGAEEITDFANLNLHVHFPVINFTIEEISSDPHTLAKTIRVSNTGDPLTDLIVSASDELSSMVMFQPSIDHAYIGTGRSVTFDAIPVLSEDFTGASGTIIASAAGEERSLTVDFSCSDGKQIFVGQYPNLTINYNAEFENDGLIYTNPPDGAVVDSYEIEGDKMFGIYVAVDVRRGAEPIYDAEVQLRVWTPETETVFSGISDAYGTAIFAVHRPIGCYSYKAELVGYGAVTETRSFTANDEPKFTALLEGIQWTNVSDADSTFDLTAEIPEEIELDSTPFSFTATVDQPLMEGAVAVMSLRPDIEDVPDEVMAFIRSSFFVDIKGTVEDNTLSFSTELVPQGTYTAAIAVYHPTEVCIPIFPMALSPPITVNITEDYLDKPLNFHRQRTVALEAGQYAVMNIEQKAEVVDPHKVINLDFIEAGESEYLFRYYALTDQTMDDTIIVEVKNGSDAVILHEIMPVHLEANVMEYIEFSVPIYDEAGNLIEGYNVTVTAADPVITLTGIAIAWFVGGVGLSVADRYYPEVGVVKCGVGLANPITGLGSAVTDIGFGAYDWIFKKGNAARDATGTYGAVTGTVAGTEDAINAGNKIAKGTAKSFNLPGKGMGTALGVFGCGVEAYEIYEKYSKDKGDKAGAHITQNSHVRNCINHAPLRTTVRTTSDLDFLCSPVQNVEGIFVTAYFPREVPASYQPFGTIIMLNGHEIGRIEDVVPKGYYTFEADPTWLNYADAGVAENTITLDVEGMNRGYYVPLEGYKIDILFKKLTRAVCVASQAEADQIVMDLGSAMDCRADFAVSPADITFSDLQPCEGDAVTIEATIHNLGSEGEIQVDVQFIDDGVEIGSVCAPYLPEFSSETVSINWTATGGTHNIQLKVNPDREINESDYTNNEAIKAISVTAPDSTPPVISNPQPPDGSTTSDNTPLISADLADPGSGINTTAVRITLDDFDVTQNATVISSHVWYTPEIALANGGHNVSVYAEDNKGNSNSLDWSFTVSGIKGDLNGDNVLTTADAAIALRMAVGARTPSTAADVSGDGSVTSLDALMILQAVAGSITL